MNLDDFKNQVMQEKNLITKSNLVFGGQQDCCQTQTSHTKSTAVVSWELLCVIMAGDDGEYCYKDDHFGDLLDESSC